MKIQFIDGQYQVISLNNCHCGHRKISSISNVRTRLNVTEKSLIAYNAAMGLQRPNAVSDAFNLNSNSGYLRAGQVAYLAKLLCLGKLEQPSGFLTVPALQAETDGTDPNLTSAQRLFSIYKKPGFTFAIEFAKTSESDGSSVKWTEVWVNGLFINRVNRIDLSRYSDDDEQSPSLHASLKDCIGTTILCNFFLSSSEQLKQIFKYPESLSYDTTKNKTEAGLKMGKLMFADGNENRQSCADYYMSDQTVASHRWIFRIAIPAIFGPDFTLLVRIVTTDGDPWVIQVLDSLSDTKNPTAIYNNCQHQLDNWHLLVLNFLEAVGVVNEEAQVLISVRRWLQIIRKRIRWPDDALYSFQCLRKYVQQKVSPDRLNSYDVYFQRLAANFPRWAFYMVKSTPGTRDSGSNESEHLHLLNEGCRRDTPIDVSSIKSMNRTLKVRLRRNVDMVVIHERSLITVHDNLREISNLMLNVPFKRLERSYSDFFHYDVCSLGTHGFGEEERRVFLVTRKGKDLSSLFVNGREDSDISEKDSDMSEKHSDISDDDASPCDAPCADSSPWPTFPQMFFVYVNSENLVSCSCFEFQRQYTICSHIFAVFDGLIPERRLDILSMRTLVCFAEQVDHVLLAGPLKRLPLDTEMNPKFEIDIPYGAHISFENFVRDHCITNGVLTVFWRREKLSENHLSLFLMKMEVCEESTDPFDHCASSENENLSCDLSNADDNKSGSSLYDNGKGTPSSEFSAKTNFIRHCAEIGENLSELNLPRAMAWLNFIQTLLLGCLGTPRLLVADSRGNTLSAFSQFKHACAILCSQLINDNNAEYAMKLMTQLEADLFQCSVAVPVGAKKVCTSLLVGAKHVRIGKCSRKGSGLPPSSLLTSISLRSTIGTKAKSQKRLSTVIGEIAKLRKVRAWPRGNKAWREKNKKKRQHLASTTTSTTTRMGMYTLVESSRAPFTSHHLTSVANHANQSAVSELAPVPFPISAVKTALLPPAGNNTAHPLLSGHPPITLS